jgi:hypothetical protein
VPQKSFTITHDKGFHIKFPNGYILSTQFGPANYCDNYDMKIGEEERKAGQLGANQVEIAVFKGNELITLPKRLTGKDHPDSVDGYIDIEKWLKYVKWLSNKNVPNSK